MRVFAVRLIIVCTLLGVAGAPTVQSQLAPFLAPFTGTPPAPVAYSPAGWDVQIHSRDELTWQSLEPMTAVHGPNCEGPPTTHALTGDYPSSVYNCANHVMTAIQAGGYGVIYLTPPVLADWTDGETVIRWDMSTKRTSLRDWVDVWISPYEEHLALPLLESFPDLTGPPPRFIHFHMDQGGGGTDAVFRVSGATSFTNGWQDLGGSWAGYDAYFTTSASRRDTFEVRLSRTHVAIGMPAYNLWWHDLDIPTGALDWTQGVVQFGHHSYFPDKMCHDAGAPPDCGSNTWHWDQVSIHPSVPITINRAGPRQIRDGTANVWSFDPPAPAGAHLQFSAVNAPASVPQIELSWNAGLTWQTYLPQPSSVCCNQTVDPGIARSYWVPVPAGAAQVQVRGTGHPGSGAWQAKDASVWTRGLVDATPVPPVVATVGPTFTPVPPPPSATPDVPTPLPTVPVTLVPTATPLPSACTVNVRIFGIETWLPRPASFCR